MWSHVMHLVVLVYLLSSVPPRAEAAECTIPKPAKRVGALEPNDIMSKAEKLYVGEILGPESLVLHGDHIYTGSTADGYIYDLYNGEARPIVKLLEQPCETEEDSQLCSRILGMRMDADGYLVVMDAFLGIFKVDVTTGDYTHLLETPVTPINGKLAIFANDLDIATDGKIYFSSSSSAYDLNHFTNICLEGDNSGRLLVFDPNTGTASELMDELFLANGVQLTEEGTAVLVAETIAARIWRYDIETGEATVWCDNLPGAPDNIRLDRSTGTYWVALAISSLEPLQPIVRQMVIGIPNTVVALELDSEGNILRSVQDSRARVIKDISEASSHGGFLYLGSAFAMYIAKVDISQDSGQ